MGILWLAAPSRWKFWVMTGGGACALLLVRIIIPEEAIGLTEPV